MVQHVDLTGRPTNCKSRRHYTGTTPGKRLLPREGITVLEEVTTQREKRRETMDFVDGYEGEHELIAGVNTVICSRCGYRDHFSKLPEECSVSRRQKDKEKRDTDEASKERGTGKSG